MASFTEVSEDASLYLSVDADVSDCEEYMLNQVENESVRHQPVGYAFEPRVNRNETVENNSVAPVANNNNAIGEETEEGEARLQNTKWCRCGNCTPMPTQC